MLKKSKTDKLFNNQFLMVLLGLLTKNGKRSKSKKILLDTLYDFKLNSKTLDRNFISFLDSSLQNILFRFVFKYRRKGKNKEIIPVPLNSDEIVYINTIRFLLKNLRKFKGNFFSKKLLKELEESSKNSGLVKKEIMSLNKLVIANRKFMNS